MGKKDNVRAEDMNVVETIKIVINTALVDMYNDLYFEKHPRRRKPPIDKCIPPSLNVWGNMHRTQKNTLKQNWNDFGEWVIEKYGVTDKMIQRCRITYSYYFPTRHLRDCDNYVCKFLSDSLVSSGFLIEDNYNVVNPVILEIFYDKLNPRTCITIEVLEEK